MSSLFEPFRHITAPMSLKSDIYQRIIAPHHSVRPWVIGGVAAASLGLIVAISIAVPSPSPEMAELADTYSTIDNPWAPPSGSVMSLLH